VRYDANNKTGTIFVNNICPCLQPGSALRECLLASLAITKERAFIREDILARFEQGSSEKEWL
jgi:hypothetical protein